MDDDVESGSVICMRQLREGDEVAVKSPGEGFAALDPTVADGNGCTFTLKPINYGPCHPAGPDDEGVFVCERVMSDE